ncbi:MAG: hypothetical protein FP825_13870 [Hyphomonas sp.]|jgi:hypothetical protein|uniref:hypothetical protein n=1 Tax=Hyphomonas sp. TaxID=87 RepID=UPI00183F70B1|nr:hypothetical protein [Hyphomonas sp.]MBA3069555.1 hypothetical protein [Hyphomonas sp.]MBU3919087.1 hypothetical protein [Alphaproteobacteria bacterium]MBU4063284.1 hypothetical protein [Alphaproteobacteria bacterium]MBU4164102.1 hypothetical protein [Alphaproteobacteria bacterium]
MSTYLKPALGLLFLALAAGLPASAVKGKTDTDKSDVLGSWSFQTRPYREGQCVMTGTMNLSPHPEEGRYDCEITAVEMCSMWGRSVVRQSCDARRFGNQVSVRSTIEEMIESKAPDLLYVPDNFTLTIQSHERMFGALVSAVTAPVEFRRANDGIS